MTLTLAKNPSWSVGEKYTSAQSNHIQNELIKAVDGVGGGTYAPSGLISIGGSGLRVTTSLSVTGSGNVNLYSGAVVADPTSFTLQGIAVDFGTLSDVTFENGFASLGTVEFQNGLGVSVGNIVVNPGNIDVTAGTLHVGGNVQFDANLSAAGTVTLGDTLANTLSVQAGLIVLNGTNLTSLIPVVLSGGSANLSVGGTSSFTGAITIGAAATVSLASIVTPTGSGRVLDRIHILPDADATVAIADGNFFIVPALGANRTYTRSTAGAVVGDIICFSAWANATANIAGVGSWNLRNAPGSEVTVWFYFNGSIWTELDLAVRP